LVPQLFVADVITGATPTPLLAAARELGCATVSGDEMFVGVRDRMLAFLLEDGALAGPRGR
jgi:shikimate dehydrogenase